MLFELTKTMAQWDKDHTLYVVLPATTQGTVVKQHAPGIQEVRFELYPNLTFLLEDEMINYNGS
jgi:hypothetical protein